MIETMMMLETMSSVESVERTSSSAVTIEFSDTIKRLTLSSSSCIFLPTLCNHNISSSSKKNQSKTRYHLVLVHVCYDGWGCARTSQAKGRDRCERCTPGDGEGKNNAKEQKSIHVGLSSFDVPGE